MAEFKYKPIIWWDGAYHVFRGKERMGIVNRRALNRNGAAKTMWFAHNKHFFGVDGYFPSREAAAKAIPVGTIKHKASALKGQH